MAYVVDIVPMEIINNPRLGTIQYHPSLLPKHRGPSSINWSIINGDKEAGITIFWPDTGLDTGLDGRDGGRTIGIGSADTGLGGRDGSRMIGTGSGET